MTTSSHTSSPSMQDDIRRLEPWFHNLHLPGGQQTAPNHALGDFPACKWRAISPHIPKDLRGWRVLDIGCNAGFYSIELARRGADVLAIDVDEHYLRQAEWAISRFNLDGSIRLQQASVYNIGRLDEKFDLVWFMGVFYHLRYPLLGLDLAANAARRFLVFQSMTMPGQEVQEVPEDLPLGARSALSDPGWPKMAFVEKRIAHDPTNWWAPNHACVLAMLRSAGLDVTAQPSDEVYLCTPLPRAQQQHPRDSAPDLHRLLTQRG